MDGPGCADRVRVYHELEHFQYALFRKCQKKAYHIRDTRGVNDATVVHAVMQSDAWKANRYREFQKLLDDADKYRTSR